MKLKWGICGAGNISKDFCHALRTLPEEEHEVVAIASSSADRAKEFAQKHNIGRSYGSYEDIAKDKDIDVVYVGTWHTNHVALSKLMLNAEKHVLCEKPMCLNVEQVKEVFQVAKEKRKLFMEAVWSRSFPIYQKIRDEIKNGSIGNVQFVTATFCVPASDHPVWKDYPGFGMLLIVGMYTVQFANWIFENKKPKSITAVATLGEKGSDEDGCVILLYENGAKASLSYNGKCQSLNPGTVYGTKGCIHIPDFFWCPTEVTMPSGKITCPLQPTDPSVYTYPNSMGLRYEADEVRKCIKEGLCESPVMSYQDSIANYEVMDEIRRQVGLKYDQQTWKICQQEQI